MALTIAMATRVLNIVFGVVGLLLLLRVVLQLFGMRWDHPLLRVIVTLTNPILQLTDRLLSMPSYGTAYRGRGTTRSDMLSVAVALVVLWTVRTVILWLFGLVLRVPFWVAQPLQSVGGIVQYSLRLVFDLYRLALIVRVLFSWIRVPYGSKIVTFLWAITEPVLAPLRAVLPPLGGIDLSPIIAFFLLGLVERLVFSMLSWVFG
jgi:YggT family protein